MVDHLYVSMMYVCRHCQCGMIFLYDHQRLLYIVQVYWVDKDLVGRVRVYFQLVVAMDKVVVYLPHLYRKLLEFNF